MSPYGNYISLCTWSVAMSNHLSVRPRLCKCHNIYPYVLSSSSHLLRRSRTSPCLPYYILNLYFSECRDLLHKKGDMHTQHLHQMRQAATLKTLKTNLHPFKLIMDQRWLPRFSSITLIGYFSYQL